MSYKAYTFVSLLILLWMDAEIFIGFEETVYTVEESAGRLEVSVVVLGPPDDQPLPLDIIASILFEPGSAGKHLLT